MSVEQFLVALAVSDRAADVAAMVQSFVEGRASASCVVDEFCSYSYHKAPESTHEARIGGFTVDYAIRPTLSGGRVRILSVNGNPPAADVTDPRGFLWFLRGIVAAHGTLTYRPGR